MIKQTLKKLTKEQKQLLIALLIGDGTISCNYSFKLSHGSQQREYLEWKIEQLRLIGLPVPIIKEYSSSCRFNKGRKVLYANLPINPTIKALRRVVYKPKKTFTRKLLNWLTPLGVAIWFMDDGHINVNTSTARSSIQHTIRISTCVDKKTADMMVDYFKQVWQVSFITYKERSKYYSILTSGENNCIKFIDIIKPYIMQLPSMWYKIRKNFTKIEFIQKQLSGSEVRDLLF